MKPIVIQLFIILNLVTLLAHSAPRCAEVLQPAGSAAGFSAQNQQAEYIFSKIKELLDQAYDRRVDVEISQFLRQEMVPYIETSSEAIRKRAEVQSSVVRGQLNKNLLSKALVIEKNLLKIAEMNTSESALHIKVLRSIPLLSRSLERRWIKKANNLFAEANELKSKAVEETSDLVALDQGLRTEIKNLSAGLEILKSVQEQLQTEHWDSLNATATAEFTDSYKRVLIQLDKQIADLTTIHAVSIALKEQINSTINNNESAVSTFDSVIGKQKILLNAVSEKEINLVATKEPKKLEYTKQIKLYFFKRKLLKLIRKNRPEISSLEELAIERLSHEISAHAIELGRSYQVYEISNFMERLYDRVADGKREIYIHDAKLLLVGENFEYMNPEHVVAFMKNSSDEQLARALRWYMHRILLYRNSPTRLSIPEVNYLGRLDKNFLKKIDEAETYAYLIGRRSEVVEHAFERMRFEAMKPLAMVGDLNKFEWVEEVNKFKYAETRAAAWEEYLQLYRKDMSKSEEADARDTFRFWQKKLKEN